VMFHRHHFVCMAESSSHRPIFARTQVLFGGGKVDEARKAFDRAEYWQAQIDSPG